MVFFGLLNGALMTYFGYCEYRITRLKHQKPADVNKRHAVVFGWWNLHDDWRLIDA
jgi:hypothetical protein